MNRTMTDAMMMLRVGDGRRGGGAPRLLRSEGRAGSSDDAQEVVRRLWRRAAAGLGASAPTHVGAAGARVTAAYSVREAPGARPGAPAREKGFPLIEFGNASLPERIGQFALLAGIWASCRVFMFLLNDTTLVNVGAAHDALLRREEGRALITVSNHVSSMDDPLMIACVMPLSVAVSPSRVRWTPCATDRCFRTESAMRELFFRLTKVVPLERGAGARFRQRGIEEMLRRLGDGDWVHWFPEGTRSRDGSIGAMRPGIGKLICEAVARRGGDGGGGGSAPPIIIPIVHRGLDRACPRDRAQELIPLSAGNAVTSMPLIVAA